MTAVAYRAYGLTWRSELPVPELPPASGIADIDVTCGVVTQRTPSLTTQIAVEIEGNEAWLSHPSIGVFHIAAGRRIVVEARPEADPTLVQTFLAGAAAGIALRQRGTLVMHASAVVIAGRAVLFVGDSGAGKSTLAAAFHAAGYRFLADDLVPLTFDTDVACAVPGFPLVKLDRRSALATGATPGRRVAEPHKANYSTDHGFTPEPVPIHRIFVITSGDAVQCSARTPSESLVELLRHTYGARSLQSLHRERLFTHCAQLAGLGLVRTLERRPGLHRLSELIRVVERDVGR